jgi:hypothetical protein
VHLIRSSALEPVGLAASIDAAIGSTPPKADIDFRGAAGTVRAVQMVLAQ